MVVEFTASTCTFCGGAVGTAPSQQRGKQKSRGGMSGRKRKVNTESVDCHSQVTKQ